MSTEFMPSRRIAFARVKRFSHNGVKALLKDGNLLLTDGTGYLWAYPSCKGRRVTFIRQGANDVLRIMAALEDYFHIRLVTEYEDEFFEIIKTERRFARRRKAARKAAVPGKPT